SAVVLISSIVFAGCSFFGGKNDPEAQKAVQTAMINMTTIKSLNYEFVLDGKVKSTDKDSAGFKELTGSVNLSGVYDTNKKADPKVSVKLVGKGSTDGGAEKSFEGEIKIANNNFYFILSKISDLGLKNDEMSQAYKQMLDAFVNKWWYVALPAESLSSFGMYSGNESELTPQEKQLKDLYEKTMFFIDVQLEGDEAVGSVAADKYSVTLDKKVFKDYIVESSKIRGQEPNKGELAEMDDFFESMEFNGFVWVSKDNKMPIKMAGELEIKDDGDSIGDTNMEMDFNVSYTVDNLGGTVTVEAPKDATKFDLMTLLGGGM
ncbi:MAG: hypothetical protein AAB953_00445, partial [Patescibacteria group bacterium]